MRAIKLIENMQEIPKRAESMNWEQRYKGCASWVKAGEDEPVMYIMLRGKYELYQKTSYLSRKLETVYERIRNLTYEEIFSMWAQQINLAPELLSDIDTENLEVWVNQEHNELSKYQAYPGDLSRTAMFLVISQYVDISKPCKRSRLALKDALAHPEISLGKRFLFFLYLHSSLNVSDIFDLQDRLGIPDGCIKLDTFF